jgi:hypothetical protein
MEKEKDSQLTAGQCLPAPVCSGIAEQREAVRRFKGNRGYTAKSVRGDCIVCGCRENTAIHEFAFDPHRRGIPFHHYISPNTYSPDPHNGN